MSLKHYIFEWTHKETHVVNRQSIPAKSEEEARAGIIERIVDFEFMDDDDQIELGALLEVKEIGDNYIVCEGCSA